MDLMFYSYAGIAGSKHNETASRVITIFIYLTENILNDMMFYIHIYVYIYIYCRLSYLHKQQHELELPVSIFHCIYQI